MLRNICKNSSNFPEGPFLNFHKNTYNFPGEHTYILKEFTHDKKNIFIGFQKKPNHRKINIYFQKMSRSNILSFKVSSFYGQYLQLNLRLAVRSTYLRK